MKRVLYLLMLFFVLVPIVSVQAENNITNRSQVNLDEIDFSAFVIETQLFYYSINNGQHAPVWSHDGSSLAFTSESGMGIWLVSAAGGAPELICENYHEYEFDGKGYASYGSLTPLAFSPDGSEIYFHDYSLYADGHVEVGGGSRGNTNPKIKAVNIATGEVRTLIEKALFGGCFTSDGRICVYRKIGDTYNSSLGLFARDLVSGEEWLLAYSGSSACITADDSEVIYSIIQDGVSQLYRVSINGGEKEQITAFTENDTCWKPTSPQCTPDGESIVFVAQYTDWLDSSGFYRNMDGSVRAVNYYGICMMDIASGHISRLCSDTIYRIDGTPRISPDGGRIVFNGVQRLTPDSDDISSLLIQDIVPLSFENPTAVAETAPAAFALKGNFPNPFNPTTTIEFSLGKAAAVRLNVYNTAGQLVRELVNGECAAGNHNAVWDGLDQFGNSVSSGVYLYRLISGGVTETKSMTLLR